MPRYQVNHTTTYTYEDPVPLCHNIARLLPRESPRHRWIDRSLQILPIPTTQVDRLDFFGNTSTFFAIQEPHRRLQVIAAAEVEVSAREPDPPVVNTAWELVRDAIRREPPADRLDARQFIFPSPYIQWDQIVLDYARPSFAPARPILDAALELTRRIHRDFVYDPNATTVTTTVAELMRNFRGVCQDLAHVEIACFRAMGLAARYVSGYLLTRPPPGRPRLVGADASHAWVSIYVPDAGWIDLDPTNNLRPADAHITIAWGRDYGDVCPLRGVLLGGGGQAVTVGVDVTHAQPTPEIDTHAPQTTGDA